MTVMLRKQGRLARITLARPPLNILDLEHLELFGEILGRVQETAVLVIESTVPKAFSAGNDIAEQLEIFEGENVDDFMGKVYDYAKQFCRPHKASLAVGHIKRAVQSGWELPLESGLALERELQAKLFASEDAKIGLGSYVKKQTPEFTGN